MAELSTKSRPWTANRIKGVRFTIGAEATNVIKVTGTCYRDKRQASGQVAVRVWLTQNTTSLAVAGTAPSGTVVIAAKGTIVNSPTAKLVHEVVTDANGEFDLNITEAGTATWYLCVALPDGKVERSAAITFAA
jgi:hypothetical protein